MKTNTQSGILDAIKWTVQSLSEIHPHAPAPKFSSKEESRVVHAVCTINMGTGHCNPTTSPWANSLLGLFKEVAPSTYPIHDSDGINGRVSVGFRWASDDYRLLCGDKVCKIQKETPVVKSEWDKFWEGGILLGCTPSPAEKTIEDVGSFGDVTNDTSPEFDASTFFNYSQNCTKYSKTWMKLIDEYPKGEIVFAPAKGGGVLVAVNNTFLLFDSDGNIVLEKKNELSSTPTAIRYFAKDGYILGGSTQGSSAQNDKSLLSKISEDCDVLWNRDLDPNHSDDNHVTITQIATMDGYFLDAEFRVNGADNPQGNPKTAVVKRDSKNGEIIWETDIKEDFWTTYPKGLWVSQNGNINVLADGVEDGTVTRWIVLNSSGKIESKKTFKNLNVNAVANTHDGGVVIVDEPKPTKGHLLRKIIENGDEQWSVGLVNIAPNLFTNSVLVQLNSDNIVVAGAQTTLSDQSSFSKIGLEIYSKDGKILNTHTYNSQGISAALYAMSMFDGGVFLGGGIKTTNKSGLSFDKILLIKTDPNGDVCK